MPQFDKEAIRERLHARILEVCQHLLPAGKRVGKLWRVGTIGGDPATNKGSCEVELSGEFIGTWKERATGEGGDVFSIWQQARGLATFNEALAQAAEFVQVQPSPGNAPPRARPLKLEQPHTNGVKPAALPLYPWDLRVSELGDQLLEDIATERGFTWKFAEWLRERKLIGALGGQVAFPVQDADGRVVKCHVRNADGGWTYDPPGLKQSSFPLVIGDLSTAKEVFAFESQWDALAIGDMLGVHEGKLEGTALYCTRGATNWQPVDAMKERLPKGAAVLAFSQNDSEDNRQKGGGTTSAEKWLARIKQEWAGPVHEVKTPAKFKDANDWTRGGATASDVNAAIETARCGGKPLKALMDISSGTPDPRNRVLGDRFLCIGAAMLFVGPSGIGKSSASVQQDILWGLGREAFGIRPARPLRILTVQAENDDEDISEMRDGVCDGLRLSEEDRAAVRERVFYESESGLTGAEFISYVGSRLALGKFDVLRIDPLLAYLGGDPSDTTKTAPFLRTGLNQLLIRYQVAAIVNHHTPKVTNRDTSNWRASDWMYSGAGSADITNWARAALVIEPTHSPHVFRFIAAKRGNRIGWVDSEGKRQTDRHYCHASDGIYWRAAEDSDVDAVQSAASSSRGPSTRFESPEKKREKLRALVPMTGSIAKEALVYKATKAGVGEKLARNILRESIDAGELFEWRANAPGPTLRFIFRAMSRPLFETPAETLALWQTTARVWRARPLRLDSGNTPFMGVCRSLESLPRESDTLASARVPVSISALAPFSMKKPTEPTKPELPSFHISSGPELARLAEESRPAVIRRCEGCLELLKAPGDSAGYPIEHSRMNTAPKVLGWIHHLCEKDWVTKEHIEAFVDEAKELGAEIDFHA